MWHRGHILDSADPETCSREHSDCSLGSWAWGSRFVAAWGPDSDVKGCDSSVLSHPGRCCGSLHRSVRRPLKPVRLHVLAPGAAGYGFSTAKIRYVNQGIVERGIDVRYTPALRYFLLRQWSHTQVNIRAGQTSSPYLTFLGPRLIETQVDGPVKSLRIRHASAADLQAICLIEDNSFSDPYPRHLLKRLLDEIRNNFLVAENGNGALVGYCVSSIEGRLAHLISIAVVTEGRRKGVATALLKNLIEYLTAHRVEGLWLEVKQNNKEAIKLYEKFDFAGIMVLENYYSDGSAALRMRRSFKKQVVKVGHKQG